VAESADADARWDRHRAGERNSTGQYCLVKIHGSYY
jgi:hypothetical protein